MINCGTTPHIRLIRRQASRSAVKAKMGACGLCWEISRAVSPERVKTQMAAIGNCLTMVAAAAAIARGPLCGLSISHRLVAAASPWRSLASARIDGHRFQHLGGGDDRTARFIGRLNQLLLQHRHLFRRQLHPQIAASYHDDVYLG